MATVAEGPAFSSRFAPFAALYFPGSSGHYVRTPDAASLDITSDITIVQLLAAADWTPAATQYTLGKWEVRRTTATRRAFRTRQAASS